MKWFNEKNGIKLECIAVKMGKDLSLILTGGDAHLGSTALAIPRLSLNGGKLSATASILNVTGHKDGVLAEHYASTAAAQLGCRCVCSCGIHIEQATSQQLAEIQKLADELLNQVLTDLSVS